jgi:hypothetical protein
VDAGARPQLELSQDGEPGGHQAIEAFTLGKAGHTEKLPPLTLLFLSRAADIRRPRSLRRQSPKSPPLQTKCALGVRTVLAVVNYQEDRMTEDRLSRLGPLSGVLFVVLEMAGFAVGSAGGRANVTLGDPSSKVLKAFADPVGSGVWVGAYLELASLAAFAVFAAWLLRSRSGPLATAGVIAAASYVAVTVVSLVVGDVLEYRAGHGMGAQETLALFDLQSGLYAASWGIGGAFLALAPTTGWLRRSALAIAALSLVAMAAPKASAAQMPAMLFFLWILVAGIALARRPAPVASATATPVRA